MPGLEMRPDATTAMLPGACARPQKVPTVDTNLVQSLINIMECQLEEAFEATEEAAAGGGKTNSKRKASLTVTAGVEVAASDTLDPKVLKK